MFNVNKNILKIITLILSGVIFITSTFVVSALDLFADEKSVYIELNDEKVTEITLNEDEKFPISAVSNFNATEYTWQVADTDNVDRWIDIADSHNSRLWLNSAIVCSMLSSNGIAKIRCAVGDGENVYHTEPLKIQYSYNIYENSSITQTKQTKYAPMMFASRSTETEEEEHISYTIVINYLFDDNSIAFEPYGASVAKGSDFSATVNSPVVLGYSPFRQVGTEYIDAKSVVLDYKNIQSNITINVIYEPALVSYKIHHHFQNIHDDGYSQQADKITTGQAITGTIVGNDLAFTEDELPGFKALPYERLTVAADGSTNIEIRYDRIYYLVDFDMAGGYGTEPVYTRYGETVGATDPIRHGYIFEGWELVSYGGNTPTLEQQSLLEISNDKTINVPAANLKYRAKWTSRNAKYTYVIWKENPDDNGYTYWDYYESSAMSGTYVDARDIVDLAVDDDDVDCFEFNSLKSDKQVLVEGDGSTVVNVYYTRKFYKIEFKANGTCAIPTNHKHNDACKDIICGKGHVHTDECIRELNCEIPIHSEHTADCIECGKEEHTHGSDSCNCTLAEHTHTKSCWNTNVKEQVNNLIWAPSNPVDGQIYKLFGNNFYIHIKGIWYKYNGKNIKDGTIVDPICGISEHAHGVNCNCKIEEHTHVSSCYKDVIHSHTDNCYLYSCGADEHIHTDACYRLKCGIPENHDHKSDTTSKVVKIVYAKYQQNLKDIWPITVNYDSGVVKYDDGQRWEPTGSKIYSQVLVFISQMPAESFTLTLNEGGSKQYTMYYYLQALPNEKVDATYGGYNYVLDNTIVANYTYITKQEDFFEIKGYTNYASSPNFSNNKIESGTTAKFYYNRRTDISLTFNNNGIVLDDKTVPSVMYGVSLKDYYFVPEYPTNLEPNAYTFGGWYTTQGCYNGTEVNWDTITMPDSNVILYAKWEPVKHTVRVFKTADLDEQIGADQLVDHKAFATAPSEHLENNGLVFSGWFYMDYDGTVPKEKAFVFSGIPVLHDMDIYAKWTSHTVVDYVIHYKLLTGEKVADSTYGNSIAGNKKTNNAKAGNELYTEFRTGFYPERKSHTITMSVDGVREFTFYYVFKESMPYTVKYVDAKTGAELLDSKTVDNNALSVVTETFVRINGMIPDAYQKRLVLSADGTMGDNGVLNENVLIFYYNNDIVHAYYRVVHYIQNISGDTYREYRSEEFIGVINSEYTVEAITLTGFDFAGNKTKIDNVVTNVTGSSITCELDEDGMLIELYYDRQIVNYRVKYIDNETKNDIHPEKVDSGLFGELVAEYAVNLDDKGYSLSSDYVLSRTLSTDEVNNLIIFYYIEKNVAIKYEIVGPMGCGSLSHSSENVLAISGKPTGSTPTVYENFSFVGWYTDSNCTNPALISEVDVATGKLSPIKTGDIWQTKTYYAKFIALETDLTITVNNTFSSDVNQAYIFNVKGETGTKTGDINLYVTVIGDSSETITKLPVGNYTVTEITDWSWRYENQNNEINIPLEYNDGSNEIVFSNIRMHNKWLDGNAVS